jgi:hypothetical protein
MELFRHAMPSAGQLFQTQRSQIELSQGLTISMAQTFLMQTEVNRQWESLFTQTMWLREEHGQYAGEGSRMKVLEAKNTQLKQKLAQDS